MRPSACTAGIGSRPPDPRDISGRTPGGEVRPPGTDGGGVVTGLAGKFAALIAVLIFTVVGCGASAPKPVDPVGGVAFAIEAAKSGGTLKAMDLVTCLTTGGATGGAFSGLFGGITGDAFTKAGITPDDLTSAWKISFENLQATERSRSGNTATVHVTVKVTSEVDPGKMRELVKKFGKTQGIVPDDAT